MPLFFYDDKVVNPDECRLCGKVMSKYETNYQGMPFTVRLCWRDSAFDIDPPELNELTFKIMTNPANILDLIKKKVLVPVK